MASPPEVAESDTDRQRVVAAVKAAIAARLLVESDEWEAEFAAAYGVEIDLEITRAIRILKLPLREDDVPPNPHTRSAD